MIKSILQQDTENVSRWQTPDLNEDHAKECLDKDALRQSAYETGFKEGHTDGLEMAWKEIAEKRVILDQLIDRLEQPFAELNQQVLDELVGLAGRIAKSLVRRELRTEPETIMAIVRESVLALNSTARRVQVYLHPDDATLIRELTHSKKGEQRWQILDDPSISRGNCRVGCGESLIDADLQTRINLIITGFLGDERGEKTP